MNNIPPMTDPLGRHWKQPSPDRIILDNTHAAMSVDAFNELSEYSSSFPSGVYEGKMWKRHEKHGDVDIWWLVWYGHSDKPGHCSNNYRQIIKLPIKT